MKRALALGALFLVVAAGAQAAGPTKARQSQKLTLVPADQYLTSSWDWSAVPGATGTGWLLQQSTAGGVTVGAHAPLLTVATTATNKRCLIAQEGALNSSVFATGALGTETTVSFFLYGLSGLVLSGTNGWFQFTYGDTTNFKVTRTGTSSRDSFGLIATGSANANNGFAQSQRLTAFVVGNAADTTYVPLAVDITVTDPLKVWIHAGPSGAVDFWINDVLQATIASPVFTSGMSNACFWFNGDAVTTTCSIGPITIQRAWP